MPFVFLSHRVAGQSLAVAPAFHANPDHGLGRRARGPQHGNRGQGFIVELGHEERFLGSNLLPDLSNPDNLLHDGHTTRLVRTAASVNWLPRPAFQASRGNLLRLAYI